MDEHLDDVHTGSAGPQAPPDGASGPVDRLELSAASFWTRGMTSVATLLVVAALWFQDAIMAVLASPGSSWRMLALVTAPPAAFVVYLVWRWWDMPAQNPAVEFGPRAVQLPVSPRSKRVVELAYGDINGMLLMSRADDRRSVLIDTGARSISYGAAAFCASGGPKRLADEVNRRIAQMPDSQAVFERMARRQKLARIAGTKPATVTKALLGVLAAYFSVEIFSGALDSQLGLLRLGANAGALIEQGQYWRVVSASFLHGGWTHIIFNGVALYFLGSVIEKLLGSWRMLLIYLVGAFVGSLGSWWFGPGALSVGSSTAIFGLFGAFLAVHLRYWRQLPPPFRQSLGWWVSIVAINAALPVVVPSIDYAAHLAGLAAGLVVTLVMLAGRDRLEPDRNASAVVRALAGVLSAITVAGLIQAGVYAFQAHPGDREQVYDSMLDDAGRGDAGVEKVNELAWLMAAQNPDAEQWQLAKARDALNAAIDEPIAEVPIEIRDTLATLDYRLARMSRGAERLAYIDEAISTEYAVFDQAQPGPAINGGGRAVYASQLAAFLDYRRRIDSPVIDVELLDQPDGVKLTAAADQLEVELARPAPDTLAIYASVLTDGTLAGLLKTCVPAGQSSRRVGDDDAFATWSDQTTAEVSLVRVDPGCDTAADFWPLVPTTKNLP